MTKRNMAAHRGETPQGKRKGDDQEKHGGAPWRDTSGQEKGGMTKRNMAAHCGETPQYQGLSLDMAHKAATDRVKWRTLAVASRARRRRVSECVLLYIETSQTHTHASDEDVFKWNYFIQLSPQKQCQ